MRSTIHHCVGNHQLGVPSTRSCISSPLAMKIHIHSHAEISTCRHGWRIHSLWQPSPVQPRKVYSCSPFFFDKWSQTWTNSCFFDDIIVVEVVYVAPVPAVLCVTLSSVIIGGISHLVYLPRLIFETACMWKCKTYVITIGDWD